MSVSEDHSKPMVRNMDRLASMEAFVRAVDLGSFAAAADALGMSGPMAGKHVRELETRLGMQLLHRTTRKQSLTDFGRAYYERCKAILAEMAAADALAADQRAELRGVLRLTLPVHFGRRCVAPVLRELVMRHPLLELEMSFTDRLSDLADDGHDLAIRTGEPGDSAMLVGRRLARQQMIVCAAPDYLAAHGTPQGIDDLAAHAAVIYRRSGPVPPWLFPEANGAIREVVPKGRLRLDDLDAIAEAAAAGAGIAWLPSWLVRAQLSRGELVQLLADVPSYPYDVHAFWLRTPHLPMKVRLAVDALAAALPKLM